jgi:WD40 repeat protein
MNQIDVLDASNFSPVCRITSAEQIRGFLFSRSDGSLVVHRSTTSVRHDVQTARQIEALAGIPEDAVWHQVSRDSRRALVAGGDGALWLWDPATNAAVRRLADKTSLVRACFSADDHFIAAFTREDVLGGAQESTVTLRVWDARTGAFVAELSPYDISRKRPMVRALCWSPDERFVLGASQADQFGTGCTIHAWDAQSGRHVADFVGPNRLNGFGLADEGRVLVAGSPNGVIYLWDFADAIDRIAIER